MYSNYNYAVSDDLRMDLSRNADLVDLGRFYAPQFVLANPHAADTDVREHDDDGHNHGDSNSAPLVIMDGTLLFGSSPVFGADPGDDTVGNTAATASTIALGSVVTGEIQSGGDQELVCHRSCSRYELYIFPRGRYQ